MDADWSVELGHDDPALEFPWTAPDRAQPYVDLRQRRDAVHELPEARDCRELGQFLLSLNAPTSPWLSAKCSVWLDDELGEAEAIYDANLKLCSYVDLIACDVEARFSFERHEQWVKSAARSLATDDEQSAVCELVVRRCWYHATSNTITDSSPGFYVTFYLVGYGHHESQARTRWANGLRQVAAVLTSSAP